MEQNNKNWKKTPWMNSVVMVNVGRFVLLVLLQVLVLQNLSWGGDNQLGSMFHIMIYPLFLMLLPHNTPHWLQILLGFLMGISVDVFYHSWGVNASASVMAATIRPLVLKTQAPKGGYVEGQSPTRYRLGTPAFLRYAAVLLFVHIFWYYCMDYFTVAYMGQILLRTAVSFPASLVVIMIYSLLLNPKS